MSDAITPKTDAALALFDPIVTDIKKCREENALLRFDYESATGNRAARSHLFKLRALNGRIDRAHAEAKAEALRVGQAIDAYKRKLREDVAAMIEVHDAPLRAIEEREAAAKAEAERLEREAREAEERRIREAQEAEARRLAEERAELERQRAELARQQREAEIARQAEERARQEAERRMEMERQQAALAAERQRQEAARKIAEAEAAQRRAEEDAKRQAEAEQRRIAAAVAEEQRRQRLEEQKRQAIETAKRREEERRQADQRHRETVEVEAMKDLLATIINMSGDFRANIVAETIRDAIKAGAVRHVTINY